VQGAVNRQLVPPSVRHWPRRKTTASDSALFPGVSVLHAHEVPDLRVFCPRSAVS